MKKYFVVLAVLLFIPLNTGNAEETAVLKAQIARSLKDGKGVVVIFMTQKESEKLAVQEDDDGGNELYADWEYYLGEFLSKNAGKLVVIQMTVKQGRNLLGSQKRPDSEYSTLFIKKGKKALYAKEAVLGVDEYKYVEAYFEGKENSIKYSDLVNAEPGTVQDIAPKDIPEELGFEYIDSPIR